jgi:hypothetical protein
MWGAVWTVCGKPGPALNSQIWSATVPGAYQRMSSMPLPLKSPTIGT